MKTIIKLFKEYNYNPYSEKEIHLDNLIDFKDYPELYKNFKSIIISINKEIEKEIFNDFRYSSENLNVITPNRLVFDFVLKGICLDKIVSQNQSSIIELDIYKEELDLNSRFLNQFAYIASLAGFPFRLKILGEKNQIYKHDPSPRKKIVSLLNFSKNDIFFELKKRYIGFNSKSNKKYLSIGDNYIMREINISLNRLNYNPIFIDKEIENKLKSISNDYSSFTHIDFIKKIVQIKLNDFLSEKIDSKSIHFGLNKTIANLYIKNVFELIKNQYQLRLMFGRIKKKYNPLFCLTSGLFGNKGKCIYDALKFNDIEVFSSEHGLTVGNSKDALESKFYNETNTTDHLFVYNEASKKTHRKLNLNTKLLSVGAPQVTKKIKNFKLQRAIYRKLYNFKKENVFYVSHNIELNSGKYYPYTKSCSSIFKDEKFLLKCLSKINKQVIYKPYPTRQFFYNKLEYLSKEILPYTNIKLFKHEEDFRYIRTVADIIITQSSESTLEWCIGLNKPLIFLDSRFYEPLEDNQVKKVFQECFFVFEYDKTDWHIDLINFLNLPYKDILKKWKEKQKYRDLYDNKHLLSLDKNAGEISVKYILSEIEK